jgi:hypothetical protein
LRTQAHLIIGHASRSPSRGARCALACEAREGAITTQVQHEKRVYERCGGLYVPRNEKLKREDISMKRLSILAAGLLVGAAALQYSNVASGQDGWVTLVDSTKMGEWDEVGKANWAMKDGLLTADKLDGKDLSYLVSKTSYKDFQIKAEFWADDDVNSGIFIRCQDPKKIDAKLCYEVNIFDKRPDPSYGTGAIVDVAKVDPMPKAGGKWNTYEITAQGPRLVVVLNGQKTVDVQDSKLASGPFALQYGSGVLKWRKVQIKPL